MSEGTAKHDDRDPVEILADEYLKRRADGENVTVDDYAARHPDLADDIREVFPALDAVKSLSTEWKKTVVEPQRTGPALPFQLGDYLLERQIGRGGMGVVYEAEHTSLRRRVAVKIMRTISLNTDKDVQRFHNEAQAAARLHHTNIVPVFDFGEASGFHFIAMQLIQGHGLDVVVERARDKTVAGVPISLNYNSPEYWRATAEIGIQAAMALDYAHSRGTLHRDVKPANLLLDEQGVIWVADFGLARQSESARTTESGTLSGTLKYLAPEQFHGRCDKRTDQYGLGLSLYELATLHSVVGDTGSHAEIMRRITEASIVPPRQRNTRVPRDLETIILKAIAPDPANRFANCKELAEDLQRFVDGDPIQSRPVTRMERLWRWSKRYPALATTTATSVLLLLLVAIVATLGYRAESEQRRRAEVTSTYALEALNTVFDEFAVAQHSNGLINHASNSTPVLSQESAVMLERLLPIFDRLAELDDESTEVRRRATDARKRVGDIQQRLGQFPQAIASYHQAARRVKTSSDGNSADTVLRLADIDNNIGTCELMLGHTEAARTSHERALEQLESHVETQVESDSSEVTYQLARTHFLLTRQLRPGESPNGVNGFGPRGGGGPRERPGGGPPGERPPRAGPRSDRSPGLDGLNQSSHDAHHIEAAVALLESIPDEQKADPRSQLLLALCLRATVPDRFSNRTEAEQSAEERSLLILKRLAIEYPSVSEYRHAYVSALSSLDTQRPDSIESRDLPAVERRLRLAIDRAEDLVAMHPYVPDYTQTLIHAHNRLAHTLERRAWHEKSEKTAEPILKNAMEAYESAARLQEFLAKRFPNARAYQSWQREFERSASRLRDRLRRQD